MAADILTSGVTGSVQRYIKKKFMDQPMRSYMSPLSNHSLGTPAVIPKHNGQICEFRKFDHFSVPTNGTDDSPKIYGESDGDPGSGQTLSSTVIEIPLAAIRDYASLGKMVRATDAIDLTKKVKDLFGVQMHRWVHRWVNDAFVKQIADTNSYGASPLPGAFKTIYAQGAANFAQLDKQATFTTADFKRAGSILKNAKVPMPFKGRYAAIVDESICNQLESDPNFKEAVLRGWKTSKVLGNAEYVDLYGMLFIKQNDEYRAALDGALTTRSDSGAVHVAHVLGAHSFTYVDLGSKQNRARAKFKVQDISKTDIELTVGWDVPFRSAVIDADFGINIAGCSNYDETLDDIA
jgi:N4-gp56 family major capsid protein